MLSQVGGRILVGGAAFEVSGVSLRGLVEGSLELGKNALLPGMGLGSNKSNFRVSQLPVH